MKEKLRIEYNPLRKLYRICSNDYKETLAFTDTREEAEKEIEAHGYEVVE